MRLAFDCKFYINDKGILMSGRIAVIMAAVLVLVAGCATKPQQPIGLAGDAVGPGSGRIGVAMTALPKQDTQVPGAGCLLCLGAAIAANSTLTTHARTLPYEDLPDLKTVVASQLRKRGADVKVIEGSIDIDELSSFSGADSNAAKKDFSPLAKKYGIDRIVILEIDAIGFIRTYSAYVPTSDPKAYLKGSAYMIDLKTNNYAWFNPVVITKSAEGKWDEPPSFPGLTNAYFQAIELGKDALVRPLTDLRAPVPASAQASPASSLR